MAKTVKKEKTKGTIAPPREEVVREALRTLERNGRLTPEGVVRAAKPDTSPLHPYFEWNNSIAANAHRLEQARQLIRSVPLILERAERIISTVRYVRDPEAEAEDQGYISIEQLQKEPESAWALLDYEFTRAAAALNRAEKLADALGVKKDVEGLAKRLTTVRRRIERRVTETV